MTEHAFNQEPTVCRYCSLPIGTGKGVYLEHNWEKGQMGWYHYPICKWNIEAQWKKQDPRPVDQPVVEDPSPVDQTVFTQGNRRIVFMFGNKYVPQWYDELTQDWYEFTPNADTYRSFPTIDEALTFLGFNQAASSSLVGTIIFKQGNYEETVRDSTGDVRLVECSEFGIVKLYRIEYKNSLGHDQHKVAYLFDAAVALFNDVCTRQEQATGSSPSDDMETRLERQATQHIEDRQHFDMLGNYIDSDTLYWN